MADYQKFEKLCKEHSITPYALAKNLDIARATLSSWKLGRYVPKKDKIEKIAAYFGVSPSYFYNDEENEDVYSHDSSSLLMQYILCVSKQRFTPDSEEFCAFSTCVNTLLDLQPSEKAAVYDYVSFLKNKQTINELKN